MSRRDRKRRRQAGHPGPRPSQPHRDNVAGELDHASGQVDEFEAALVSGAHGEAEEGLSDAELAAYAQDAAPAEPAGPSAAPATARPGRAAPGQPTQRGLGRMFAFFRASWAELQRVQWPDRRQVAQATAVVLGFVVIAGAYLGIADVAAQKVIDLIL